MYMDMNGRGGMQADAFRNLAHTGREAFFLPVFQYIVVDVLFAPSHFDFLHLQRSFPISIYAQYRQAPKGIP